MAVGCYRVEGVILSSFPRRSKLREAFCSACTKGPLRSNKATGVPVWDLRHVFQFTTKLSTRDRDVGFRHKIAVLCMWNYIAGK